MADKTKVILPFRVTRELRQRAKIISAQTGRPLQQVLEELLSEWVAKQEKQIAGKADGK